MLSSPTFMSLSHPNLKPLEKKQPPLHTCEHQLSISSLECHAVNFCCVPFFYGFCIFICACDKQIKDSIHIRPTAAASGPDGNPFIWKHRQLDLTWTKNIRIGSKPGTNLQVSEIKLMEIFMFYACLSWITLV